MTILYSSLSLGTELSGLATHRASGAVFSCLRAYAGVSRLRDKISSYIVTGFSCLMIAIVRILQRRARERLEFRRARTALLFYYWENIVNSYGAALAIGKDPRVAADFRVIKQIPEYGAILAQGRGRKFELLERFYLRAVHDFWRGFSDFRQHYDKSRGLVRLSLSRYQGDVESSADQAVPIPSRAQAPETCVLSQGENLCGGPMCGAGTDAQSCHGVAATQKETGGEARTRKSSRAKMQAS